MSEKDTLISVIVPAYNCEKYVKRCLYSLINQTYQEIEIIVIDDGSTDGTLSLCKEVAKLDCRVKVISKENSGVSDSRNLGISLAIGNWITFVDADDYLDCNALQSMFALKKQDTQMIFGRIKKIFENGEEENLVEKELVNVSKNNLAPFFLYGERNVMGSACRVLYLKEVIVKNGILFNKNVSICEDLLFVVNVVSLCDKIEVSNEYVYNYFIMGSSCSRTKDDKFFNGIKNYYSAMSAFLREKYPQFLCLLDYFYVNMMIHPLLNEKKFSYKIKQAIKQDTFLDKCLVMDNVRKLTEFYPGKKNKIKIRLLFKKRWRLYRILYRFNCKVKRVRM